MLLVNCLFIWLVLFAFSWLIFCGVTYETCKFDVFFAEKRPNTLFVHWSANYGQSNNFLCMLYFGLSNLKQNKIMPWKRRCWLPNQKFFLTFAIAQKTLKAKTDRCKYKCPHQMNFCFLPHSKQKKNGFLPFFVEPKKLCHCFEVARNGSFSPFAVLNVTCNWQ